MARKQQLAALADAGITADDQAQIEKARRIIDAVNARLAARGAALMFCIIPAVAHTRQTWPASSSDEIHEH